MSVIDAFVELFIWVFIFCEITKVEDRNLSWWSVLLKLFCYVLSKLQLGYLFVYLGDSLVDFNHRFTIDSRTWRISTDSRRKAFIVHSVFVKQHMLVPRQVLAKVVSVARNAWKIITQVVKALAAVILRDDLAFLYSHMPFSNAIIMALFRHWKIQINVQEVIIYFSRSVTSFSSSFGRHLIKLIRDTNRITLCSGLYT